MKIFFYQRFKDEIYSRWKLGDKVFLDRLCNYHPNIELFIELNSSKFLYTKCKNISSTYKFEVYQKNIKLFLPPTLKTLKEIQSMAIFFV